MSTHPDVVTVTPGGPLEILEVPTPEVSGNQVKVINQWTASTPLDLHQADGNLLVKPPQILGDGTAGTILFFGPDVKHLRPGDQVFRFTWRSAAEKAPQLYVVAEENLFAKLPAGRTLQKAVVVSDNFVTAWHALTKELGLELPWPRPAGYVPPEHHRWILIWGGSSSDGMYVLQVLEYYGYKNLITMASKAHHQRLKMYGARICFDYRDDNVIAQIKDHMESQQGNVGLVLDCIGSLHGSIEPIAQIATAKGAKIAVLFPVTPKDAAPGVRPEYELDAQACVVWAKGVEVSGVRAHSYTDNQFLAEKLQPQIMPTVLAQKIVKPNDQIIVRADTLLQRAENALSMLREKKVSGGRLVWRVAEDEEVETAMKQVLE